MRVSILMEIMGQAEHTFININKEVTLTTPGCAVPGADVLRAVFNDILADAMVEFHQKSLPDRLVQTEQQGAEW